MKRNHLLSLTVLLLQIIPVASFAEVCIDGIYYNLDSNTKEAAVTYHHSEDFPTTNYNYNRYNSYKGEITIPSTIKHDGITYKVTSIEDVGFAGNASLTTVNIPNSITYIGERAFNSCIGLTTITIPKSVTSISYRAFSGCNNLSSIIVDKDNKVYDSRNNCNAIIETETNELIQGCPSTIIPNTVTRIGEASFAEIKTLTSITIPESVTSIGESAFSGSGILSVVLPKSIIHIDKCAFYECRNLTSITLPEALDNISYGTFASTGLKSITFPASVEMINEGAIENLELESIYFESTTPPNFYGYYMQYTGFTISNNVVIHVPVGCKDIYMNNDIGKKHTIIDDIVVTEKTTFIGSIEKSNSTTSNIFDLAGRRLTMQKKGINIINGKKVLTKQ